MKGPLRWPIPSSSHAPTELATSSLHAAGVPSSPSYVDDFSFRTIDPACSPSKWSPKQAAAASRPSAAHLTFARPIKAEPDDGLLTDRFDQAYLRYQAALDAIAAKYADARSDDNDDGESSGIELVEPGELVDLLTRRLVKDEPLSDDDVTVLGFSGSEADEVDGDDALDGPVADAREELLLTQPAGQGSGSRRTGSEDGIFGRDG